MLAHPKTVPNVFNGHTLHPDCLPAEQLGDLRVHLGRVTDGSIETAAMPQYNVGKLVLAHALLAFRSSFTMARSHTVRAWASGILRSDSY